MARSAGLARANVQVRIADNLAVIELDYGEQEPTELSIDLATAKRLAKALREALSPSRLADSAQ